MIARPHILVAAAALAGCGADALEVCAAFSGKTCLVVRARGRDPVDQLELTALSGFALAPNPARTPSPARDPFSLPVLVPIDLGNFAGEFRLRVAGLLAGEVRAVGAVDEVIARGERKLIEVQMVRVDSDGGALDLAAVLPDLSTDDGTVPGECTVDCSGLPGVDPTKVRCSGASCDVTGACLPGRGHCSTAWEDGCEADFTSASTCGSCSVACKVGTPYCAQGTCVASCPGATQMCGSGCVSFDDPATCGGCDMRCGAPPGAVASCDAGQCGWACAPDAVRMGDECLQWQQQTSAVDVHLYAVYGTSQANLFVGGESGTLLHSSGNDIWNGRQVGLAGDITGIWGTAIDLSLSDSDGRIHHSDDGISFNATSVSPIGLWSLNGSGSTAWAVSFNDIYRRTNFTWGSVFHDDTIALLGVFASGSEVFTVGNINLAQPPLQIRVGVVRRSSTGWMDERPTFSPLFGVWATSAGNAYAVGRGGTIVHFIAGTWTVEQNSGPDLHAVGGSGADDVYAVGEGGAVLHSTGNGVWAPQTSGVTTHLRAVWGIDTGSARIVYTVGDTGVILKKL